ncbi:unnamed protein product [Paramecium sonneborni]|uniref:Uncharacterized protein n=1 Tax=Paramecium sonneborni TaxID=65129 RepID=A0A8S1RN42_9CILI|nr:unnamed protein product [Paramecium sonneborni]
MKSENIQKNLDKTNQIEVNWSDPLVIFTTRSEIFTNIDYRDWFASEEKNKFQEIQLLKFDEEQTKEYLLKFKMCSIKILIFEIYEQQIEIKRGSLDFSMFELCWQKILDQLVKFNDSKQKSDALLNQKQIESILGF